MLHLPSNKRENSLRMKKYYLFFILAATLFTAPVWANEDGDNDGVEAELTPIAINVNGSQVHITGAAGKTLEIFNVAGVRVATFKIDNDDKTLNLNLGKGCYILKAGKVVRKVSIR